MTRWACALAVASVCVGCGGGQTSASEVPSAADLTAAPGVEATAGVAPAAAPVVHEAGSTTREDVTTVAVGAGAGAVIGALVGGGSGAARGR